MKKFSLYLSILFVVLVPSLVLAQRQPSASDTTQTPSTTPTTSVATPTTTTPAAVTTPTATPTTTVATPPATTTPAPTVAKKAYKPSGYVKLYEHKGMGGYTLTLGYGRGSGDTDSSYADQGGANFKDKCSSVSYKIPAGWRVSLYEHKNYGGRAYTLTGSGSISDLGYMNDKCSSVRWEKN